MNPLTAHLGVQLTAAVAAVWSRKRVKRHSKVKVSEQVKAVAELTRTEIPSRVSSKMTSEADMGES